MEFAVKLIRIPPIGDLSGWQMFELMATAQHVAGDFWIFEGDVEALRIGNITIEAEGVTSGTGDMDDSELLEHCQEIFGLDLSQELADWEMLRRTQNENTE